MLQFLQMEQMKKVAFAINTFLMGFVFLAAILFWFHGINLMVYYSLPALVAYGFFFYLIHRSMLDYYVWAVYAVITGYMITATISLGYNYGFHLYCASLIPLSFYMEYFSYKLHTKRTRAFLVSILIVVAYLICSIFSVLHGPVYEGNMTVACITMVINALCVFFLLISYGYSILQIILANEAQLSDMAHTDQLTGLYNRHYMLTHLEELDHNIGKGHWIAMADIDGFKAINDCYGHGCGDYVLKQLSQIMRETCKECVVCRWGGEEFLIATKGESIDRHILEQLRQTVEHTPFTYCGQNIKVTLTIGISAYQAGQSLDSWVRSTDEKLYEGKRNGKNQLVY